MSSSVKILVMFTHCTCRQLPHRQRNECLVSRILYTLWMGSIHHGWLLSPSLMCKRVTDLGIPRKVEVLIAQLVLQTQVMLDQNRPLDPEDFSLFYNLAHLFR